MVKLRAESIARPARLPPAGDAVAEEFGVDPQKATFMGRQLVIGKDRVDRTDGQAQ